MGARKGASAAWKSAVHITGWITSKRPLLTRTVYLLLSAGADQLSMSDSDVVAAIQSLKRSDFDKSMTSIASSRVWQDVYRPIINGRMLYVKFTTDAQQAWLLISFKEA
jgi:motility quorum-sensing regulator/GCU-specific mRNA interferase toxin